MMSSNHVGCHLWFKIGLKLGISEPKLHDIETNHSNVEDRFQACLSKWLKEATTKGKATLNLLASAIESIGEKHAAKKIREFSVNKK